MKQKINFLTALVIAAGALTASVTGCELIASVDRSKIPGAGGSGGGGGTGGATSSTSSSGTGGGTGGSTTSSSGTGGSTTSSSGTGGAPTCDSSTSCTTLTDCPDTGTECVQRTCDNGCCGTKNVDDGTPTTAGQTDKNCKKVVCDGNGGTKTVDDNNDLPDPMDACHIGTCTAGTPGQTPASAGTVCSIGNGTVCDGNGLCVECNVDGNCTGGKVCDPANGTHTCVDAGCSDGAQNQDETDKDCGGICGATCGTGKSCLKDGDCIEGNCDNTKHCAAATCADTKQDGALGSAETDVDCGGPCVAQGKPCTVNQGCKVNADCDTKYCDSNHKCAVPTCNDGVVNGNETDKDCGGGSFQGGAACPACDTGKICSGATDCKTGYCNGSTCDTKPGGLPCGTNGGDSECTSGACGTNGSGNCCSAACTTGSTCGATGCAVGTGACVYPTSATTCGSSCANGMLTVSACDGSGSCKPGTATACAGGFTCASATACKTTCSVDTDCQSTSDYCSGGACVPKHATGACTGNNQCQSGICGTSGTGNCCTAACSPTGGTCGATGCDAAGACVFPGNSTVLPTGQTAHDCQSVVCDGAGGTKSVDDLSDTPVSNTVCLGSPACTGTPAAPSFTPAAAGTDCTADGQPGKTVCGSGTAAGTCVECNVNANCGAATCSGSMLTTPTCDAAHTCSAGTPTACPNNFACAGSACGTSCSVTGTAPAGTSVGCAAGAYCDTVPSTPACSTTLKATGAVCNNAFECSSGTCCTGAGTPDASCTAAGCL